MTYLKEGERLDDLERNGFKIIQDPNKFCFGMDAVLLSGFAQVRKNETALDLGTGTGIIPILLKAKTEGKHFTGLEIQEESADMARRSVGYNGLDKDIDIVTGDIKEASGLFPLSSFDVVTCNPPYMTDCHGLKNPEEPKAIARHEILCTLEDVVREAGRLVRPGGRFYMVHRPFRLVEIFDVMTRYKLEPKRMKLVYPFINKEPNMVLIEAVRGGRSRLKVEAPLIVYKAPGVYTDEIYDIYGY
ncbi:MAG TPA: tRNA1(Val) (adenine(37)-N6)-methyltransferase [Candidatus Onthocola gallistercoris]|uniref:tRNA1(Val) (Adenine(37)-N6)-methyltransferase n=1 Tax=Candidatus Onthocola gallistercoris TaxID=2840876 RepID=A0A9D1HFD2_9FIRM|nr:tRNA1(Val) (adenine(37)-N6)-methyltransferase [Candidatus Onthocola gallistercoris]